MSRAAEYGGLPASGGDGMSAIATTTALDYAVLSPEMARAFRVSATAIRAIQRSAITDVGQHLIEAKNMLNHGAFTAWAEAELGMTPRTAQRYMTAGFLTGKPTSVSYLPPTLVYKLAAPRTPSSFVEEVAALAERDALPPPREIREKLAVDIRSDREARVEAAKSPEQGVRERENMRRRLTAEKAREQRRQEEYEAEQAVGEARAHNPAANLVAELGAAGMVELFRLMHGTGWYLIERRFTGTGQRSGLTSSPEKVVVKFGGVAA